MASALSRRHLLSAGLLSVWVLAMPVLAQQPAPTAPARLTPPTPPRPIPPRPAAAPTTTARPPVVTPPRQPNARRPTGPARPTTAPARPAPPPPAPPPPVPEPAVEPGKGSVTQLPIPRFAALKTDEVNMRTGPGQRYPVEWLYKRRDLPVQIEREFDVWRLVRDPEGVKGWVHQATLTGRRSFIVTGGEHPIRRSAGDDAAVVAVLKPGVVGLLRKCEATAAWCQVQVGEHRGWLKRSDFWGSLPNEAIN